MQVRHSVRSVGRLSLLALLTSIAPLALPVAPLRAADDDLGIFIMKIDGSEERKVAQIDGFAKHWAPRWSHDGQRLVFDVSAGPDGTRKIYIVNRDGTNLQQVGEGSAADWSPDDQLLVFQYAGGGMRTGLWMHDLQKGSRNWIIDGTCPRWSADGSKIAFTVGQTIRYLDLEKNEDRLVVDEARLRTVAGCEWSHDGQSLAFFGRRALDQPSELDIANLGEVGQEFRPRFSRPGFVGGHVSWSPDDKQLAFTIESFIYVIDVEGDNPPQRLPGQADKSRDPCWSPDGQWMAFARRRFP